MSSEYKEMHLKKTKLIYTAMLGALGGVMVCKLN